MNLSFVRGAHRVLIVGVFASVPLACGNSGGGNAGGSAGTGIAGSSTNPAGGAGGVPQNAGGSMAQSGAGTGAGLGGNGGGSGGVAAGGNGGAGGTGGGSPFPGGRGAAVPYITYEAEDMETTGSQLGPSRTWGEVASEASGRKAVRLAAQDQHVRFTTTAASNSIVVRYSVPDGTDAATLTLSIGGGAEKKLNVTSKYVWSYGGAFNQPAQNDPGQGQPHHFFDEARLLIPEGIPAGAVVELKKGATDTAANYDIDLVELEQVGEPLPIPAGFKSIADCGADGTDNNDDSAAFQTCIDMPHGQGLYIPPGRFVFSGNHVNVAGVTIRGAGMWHSTIAGPKAHFLCTGDNCKYYDFAVFGETTARDDAGGGLDDAAFSGPQNSGTVLDHIWVEHRRVGFWSGLYPDSGDSNVTIKDSRFRNLHADGINFYGGITDSVIENCHFRNTGDDAIASWSHAADAGNGHPPNSGNVFRHNTIQNTWMANCFGIYGGSNLSVEDNACADTVQLAGILVAQSFDSHAFGGTTSFARNLLLRDGGYYDGAKHGAVKLQPQQGNLTGVSFTDLDVIGSTYSGVNITGGAALDAVSFTNTLIQDAAEYAVYIPAEAHGAVTLKGVKVSGGAGGLFDDPGNDLNVVDGGGNSGL